MSKIPLSQGLAAIILATALTGCGTITARHYPVGQDAEIAKEQQEAAIEREYQDNQEYHPNGRQSYDILNIGIR